MPENRPIPVNAARKICEEFDQEIVVIVAWHQASNMLNVVTYAQQPRHKQSAATLGDLCAKAAGCVGKQEFFEDYRQVKEAEWAAEKADLLRRIDDLTRVIAERDREDAEGPVS